ncbi:hypothetical protein [Neisseria lactamica]|nr:hypothetical protein [Neisseria lactamica]KFJ36293.1 putative membrane protein [Neisseria lactamica ATCC 23970]CBX23031.1 unnamed protein product [Neisseria lactamica Y92-1009]SUA15418.1 Uncharacterised protein [Neisseria lactamica]SUA17362.1 Uncharacterised protein [Neisseria lactamica]VTQ48313.1 Uncharacterised protein [Neisseria lactamica]
MTLNKVFALSVIALGLAACSSTGSGSTADNSFVSGAGVATNGAVVASYSGLKRWCKRSCQRLGKE